MTGFGNKPVGGWLDRAIDKVVAIKWPRRAWTRNHFRRMSVDDEYARSTFKMLEMRGYRNARSTTTATPWSGSRKSADAEILHDRKNLVSRSREVNRDDPLGAGITGTFVTNTIFKGSDPQARTGNDDWNLALEAIWKARADHLYPADRLTYHEAQQLSFRKALEDGDVLIKKARTGPEQSLWLEIIETDRIATPQDLTSNKLIREGVERDEFGHIVAYWVQRTHPGDILTMTVQSARGFVRVDARDAVLLKETDRPGQTRGVPLFHAILQDLRDLDLLMLASLKRTQIAACLAVFIKSNMPVDDILDVTAEKYGYRLDDTIEPGMIFKLFPDEEAQFLNPNFPPAPMMDFIITIARRIGAALGMSWQVVLKDFSNSNFSSARADLLETRAVYLAYHAWLVEKLYNWEWATVMEEAALEGDVRLAGIPPEARMMVTWSRPGWRWVDPVKEAKGVEIKLKNHLSCWRDEIAAFGGPNWEEVFLQCVKEEKFWNQARIDANLPPMPLIAASGPAVQRADEPEPPDEPRGNGSRGSIIDGPNGNRGLARLFETSERRAS